MITLTAPTLTPGKVDQLKRTRDWLSNLRESLLTKADSLEKLRDRLSDAQKSRSAYEAKAAFDAKAASQLAGVSQQLQHLTPIVSQAERELQRDVDVASAQIGNVRRDDIKELLRVPLYDELLAEVKKQIGPLYRKEEAGSRARSLATDTELFRQTSFYLNRIAPRPTNAVMAAAWLALTVAEIDGILAGDEVIGFECETGETRVIDRRVSHKLKIDIDELVADSQR